MTDDGYSGFLLGKLTALEERLRQELTPPPEPAAPPIAREPTAAEANQHFLDHVQEIAGVKPQAAKAAPEVAPATLSRAHPRFAHEFAKHAAAIASGTCEVVE